MNSKALAAVASLWLPVVASAADGDVTTKLDTLSQKLERILATQGISFGGQFRGEFGASDLSGNSQVPSLRTGEQIGYTSVDFDLRARPNTLTQARAVFRMSLDHASFFGSPYTPIETRWLSLDGTAGEGIFYYHLGNYQQRWTPFTMWSPDPGFIYTPRIFAQQQKQVMDERFLGNNVRNLQGVNFGIRAAVPSVAIDSFNVGLLAAKLLTAAPIGAPGDTFVSKYNSPGDGSVGWPDSLANFDRWTYGGKGTVTFLKAFSLGAHFLAEKDLKSTFGAYLDTGKMIRTVTTTNATGVSVTRWSTTNSRQQWVDKDSLAQNGMVFSGTLGADVAKFIKNENLILGLNAEFAHSTWDMYTGRDLIEISGHRDSLSTTSTIVYDTGRFSPLYTAKAGNALNVALTAGWSTKDFKASVTGGYLKVDSGFRADLAQTKVFNPNLGRIYNSEQDAYDPNSSAYSSLLHYNTFDAMYHSVHHWIAADQNEYTKTPYEKIAYSNYVPGRSGSELGGYTLAIGEIASQYLLALADPTTDTATLRKGKLAVYRTVLESGIDRDLQLVMPGGEATANRVGPKAALNVNVLGGGVEALANVYMLNEVKGTLLDSSTQVAADKAKFQQVQGGVKFRLDRFVPGWNTFLNPKTPQPLEISASFGQSTAKGGTWLNYTSTEIAASVYVGVLPRVALLGGYQAITGKDKSPALVDRNQTDIAGGLEFKIQEGAYFLAMYNLLKTEYPNASEFNFDQKIWSTKISVSF